jgi:glycosyltransferase involved in cell wall biosynthesis
MNVVAVTDYLNNVGGAELSARTIIRSVAENSAVDDVVVVGVDLTDEETLDYGSARIEAVEFPDFTRNVPDFAVDLVVERLLARRARDYLGYADVVHAHHRRSTLALRHLPEDVAKVGTVRDYWPVCPISVYNVDCEQCTGCEDRLDDCVEYQGWTGVKGAAAKPYLLTKRRHYQHGLDPLDATVYIANHLRETIESDYRGTHPSRDEVIYNPVSIDGSFESELHPSSTGPRFVTASTLNREKGVDLAIDAVAELAETYPDVELQVFGNGPLESELRDRAERKCPPGIVSFEGRVPQERVYEAISRATATVFPSRWAEPFGRITVESLMLGTPVVGSDVGGIAEVVDDGETGVLFENGNAEDLALRLRTIHEDGFRDQVISWNETEREAFEPETVAQQYVDFYQSLS